MSDSEFYRVLLVCEETLLNSVFVSDFKEVERGITSII